MFVLAVWIDPELKYLFQLIDSSVSGIGKDIHTTYVDVHGVLIIKPVLVICENIVRGRCLLDALVLCFNLLLDSIDIDSRLPLLIHIFIIGVFIKSSQVFTRYLCLGLENILLFWSSEMV